MKNHAGAMFEMEKLLILWTENLKKKPHAHMHIQTHTHTHKVPLSIIVIQENVKVSLKM